MEQQTRSHSYAKSVLDAAGFKFQHRNHADGDSRRRLDIKRFSNLDIDGGIRDFNTELLSSFVEDIVWCEIKESDLKLYGDITIVKLIQVAQLIIEYLIHAKDTLASNLDALAKMYSAKKREIEALSIRSPCPSQDCDPVKSPDASNDGTSKPTSTLRKEHFHLHIVSSTNALYIRMNVEHSITVQNLKNKLVSRLLLAEGTSNTNFDSHLLYYKDNELKDSSRTLNYYQIENGAGLVFMPRHQHFDAIGTLRPVESIAVSSKIESRLEKLASLATTSHEELILATRAFQFQLSMQDASKEAFLHDVGKQIRDALQSQVLLVSSVEHLNKHVESSDSSTKKHSTLDEVMETSEGYQEHVDTSPKNETNQKSAIDVDGQSGVPLRVDTSAEGFNVVVSPFHPPSEIASPFKLLPCEIEATIEATQNIETADGIGKIETPKSMNRPANADLEIEFSMNSLNSMLDDVDEVVDKRVASPNKGYLLYHGNADPSGDTGSANSPSTGCDGAIGDGNNEQQLWSSDDFLADGDDSEEITEIINHCSSTVLKISSGKSTTSETDDLQSIAISQSEPETTNHHAEVNVKKSNQFGKKKGHFHLLKKVTKGLLLSKK